MLGAFICLLIKSLPFSVIVRTIIVLVCIIWAIVGSAFSSTLGNCDVYPPASIGFFAGVVPNNRKLLAIYPVVLFYLIVGWMVLLGTNEKIAKPQ